MLRRHVYRRRSDPHGDIAALISTTAAWSPRAVADAIDDIESGQVCYLVDWGSGPSPVVVVRDDAGARLDVVGPDGSAGGLSALPSG